MYRLKSWRIAGLSAVHERGRMTLVDRRSGAERAALTMGRPTAPVLALNIAEGSLEECRYYLILARDLTYGNSEVLLRQLEEVSRMLDAYMLSLSTATDY